MPAVGGRRDQRGVVRVAGGEGGDAVVPVGAAVELEVPGVEVDLGEEGVDRGVVGQELAVEQAHVPADQHVADVEDHGGRRAWGLLVVGARADLRGRPRGRQGRWTFGGIVSEKAATSRREGRAMKLLRYGPKGAEKPGLLDAGGTIRDLSGVVGDIGGATLSDEGLERLRRLDAAAAAGGRPGRAARAVRRRGRQVRLHRAQLLRPCGGDRGDGAVRADRLHEGDERDLRAERSGDHPARVAEDRLGGRAGGGDRPPGEVRRRGRRASATSPATAWRTTSRSGRSRPSGRGSGPRASRPTTSGRPGRGW